jgi:N-acetyl-anhydromuramyl-L-alanine amidase AmpD
VTPHAKRILRELEARGVSVAAGNLVLCDGFDDTTIEAEGTFDPAYVVLHDTGTGIPTSRLKPAQSLEWMIDNEYRPIRAAHFLISREPKPVAYFVYAHGCYHAGKGGPYGPAASTPGDTNVSLSSMNHRSYGIEHESSGLAWDLLPKQVELGARVTAALLASMGKGVENVLNHKDWTDGTTRSGSRPGQYAGRKVDTRQSREWWWAKVRPFLKAGVKDYRIKVTGSGRLTANDIAKRLGIAMRHIVARNPLLLTRRARRGDLIRVPGWVPVRPLDSTPTK